MNILYGLILRDTGIIKIRGNEVDFQSPRDAISLGIGMVHQHFKLIPTFTVTENVVLGAEPLYANLESRFEKRVIKTEIPTGVKGQLSRFGRSTARLITGTVDRGSPINFRKAKSKIKQIAEDNALFIDPNSKIEGLSVGMQQRVEIIKVLYREAEILILDEPTAVLTPQEVDELFETLARLRKAGKTIILITHKLREPMALCDRITVLRDGKLVGTVEKAQTTPAQLAKMMVGRPVVFRVAKTKATPGQPVLTVENLQVKDDRGLIAIKNLDLEIHAGEILGLAGVEGNGQLELVETLWGLRKPLAGKILFEGQLLKRFHPRKIRERGIGYIPQDRHKRGLILDFSIKENMVLGPHYRPPYSMGPFHSLLNPRKIIDDTNQLVDKFDIKIRDLDSAVHTLSGGNQQKIIVARALAVQPRFLIASHPTRGLDVGATEFIHQILIEMRDKGLAILLVSADLDEIRNVADRIAVIFEGRIVAVKEPDETDERELGLLMAGQEQEQTT
jgi:simple sugar transport system ATP-binding protein